MEVVVKSEETVAGGAYEGYVFAVALDDRVSRLVCACAEFVVDNWVAGVEGLSCIVYVVEFDLRVDRCVVVAHAYGVVDNSLSLVPDIIAVRVHIFDLDV